MVKKSIITVKDTNIRTMTINGIDYVCITDIARQKNAEEPKDVVKNWMRLKNTIEYMGLWEKLNNPQFKGGRIRPPFIHITQYDRLILTLEINNKYRYHYDK